MTEQVTIKEIGAESVICSCSTSVCKSCSGNSFCNIKVREIEARRPDDMDLSPGDQVEIYLPAGKTVFAGFMVMIFPLILFGLLFYITGRVFPSSGEGLQVLGGVAGLFLGFGISRLYSMFTNQRNLPRILRVLEKDGPV